jgi:3-mercaptopyruvate sulfurtransferase SseA
MTKIKFTGIPISVLVLVTLACNAVLPRANPSPTPTLAEISPQGDLPQMEDDVPRISVQDARAALEAGTAIVVDVRSESAYTEGHIPGAVSIPLDEFERNVNGIALKKDQWIITYCT